MANDSGDKNIRVLHQEYNCAIANGLVMKARRISRQIARFEELDRHERR